MKHLPSLFLTVSLVALSGCASIVNGSSQKVQVTTNPPSQSSCTLNNTLGNASVVAPSQSQVARSKKDLNITCTDRASGYTGSQVVESNVEPWLFGNLLLGGFGLIGAPIDFATGAAWEYPSEITIALKPAFQPAAAYDMQPAAAMGSTTLYGQPAAVLQPVVKNVPATAQTAPSYQPAAGGTTYYAPANQAAPRYEYLPPAQPQPPAAR